MCNEKPDVDKRFVVKDKNKENIFSQKLSFNLNAADANSFKSIFIIQSKGYQPFDSLFTRTSSVQINLIEHLSW